MYCTVLPPKLERHRKKGARLRKGPQRHGGNQASRGTRKLAHMVLQRNAESHRAESHSQVRELTTSDRMKVEVLNRHQGITDEWEVNRPQRVDQIVQASPNKRLALTSTQNTYHLSYGRIHHVQMEETKCRPWHV